jgi:hypothetical protein
MTTDETRKLLMEINTFYPRWKVEDPEETVSAWHSVLETYGFTEAKAALRNYVKNDCSGYAPSLPQLIQGMGKYKSGIDWDEVAREIMEGQT